MHPSRHPQPLSVYSSSPPAASGAFLPGSSPSSSPHSRPAASPAHAQQQQPQQFQASPSHAQSIASSTVQHVSASHSQSQAAEYSLSSYGASAPSQQLQQHPPHDDDDAHSDSEEQAASADADDEHDLDPALSESASPAPSASPSVGHDGPDLSALIDPSDLLARLCSSTPIRADDLVFWRSVMEGIEWAFYDSGSSEIHRLVDQYCASFVANAAKSGNMHALLLVVCRHLETYAQHIQSVAAAEASGGGDLLGLPSSSASASSASTPSSLAKDHAFVTQLLYFFRLIVGFLLGQGGADRDGPFSVFFEHLSSPDAASTPASPKSAEPSASASAGGKYSDASNWGTTSGAGTVGRGGAAPSATHSPAPKHHTINLNPSSRRGSLTGLSKGASSNVNSDPLTRLVKAIVGALEALADTETTSAVYSGKRGKTRAKSSASSPMTQSNPVLVDLHLELLNTLWTLCSSPMYPAHHAHEDDDQPPQHVFLERLLALTESNPSAGGAGQPVHSPQALVTGFVRGLVGVLPADWRSTLAKSQAKARGGKPSLFGRLASVVTSIITFPVWGLRSLFTLPPNNPLVDRGVLLLELMVYQSSENEWRSAVRGLRDADAPSAEAGAGESRSLQESMDLGLVSFDALFYALCSTLTTEHATLFLYTLIHENGEFLSFVLRNHKHDLDALVLPMLEVLYEKVDISRHHVYMIINIWILLTQQAGFDSAIKSVTVRAVPFFKEYPLDDLKLTEVMQVVLLRTLQLNLRTKLKEPHIFNNCLAAFCNLTITALLSPASDSSSSSPPASPSSSAASILSAPLTLHPQVSFRLTRVLCILSRKFLTLQLAHDALVAAQQAREAEGLLDTDEAVEADAQMESTADELATCIEFIQLLLEVVNHAIVHAAPAQDPNAESASAAASSSSAAAAATSLASNPHLLYNLIHSQDYFLQLLPYHALFEANLISNVTSAIAFYERASGVHIPSGDAGKAATAGGGDARRNKQSEKEVEASVAALRKAIASTPLHPHRSAAASAPAPAAGSTPSFDSAALIERGLFTYHEQANSQDFFLPYCYSLAQGLHILPRLYNSSHSSSLASSALNAAAEAMGDLNADEVFHDELQQEEDEAAGRPSRLQPNMEEYYEQEEPEAQAEPEEDFSKLKIAIK